MASPLTLEIGFSDEAEALNWDDLRRSGHAVILARVQTLGLTLGSSSNHLSRHFGVIFLPRRLTQRLLAQAVAGDGALLTEGHDFLEEWKSKESLKAHAESPLCASKFLAAIHPDLADERLCAILFRNDVHSPADVALLDLTSASQQHTHHLLDVTNNRAIHDTSQGLFLLKLVLVSNITTQTMDMMSSRSTINDETAVRVHLPTCPLCIHRIDPVRVGLLKPRNAQLCSQFCPPQCNVHDGRLPVEESCKKQQLLRPWPAPSRCLCCQNILSYWTQTIERHEAILSIDPKTELADMFCYKCPMQETLWVCLTCGFVGCGRYSNGHAAEHYYETKHPYSLELATLRIWDYVEGEYAHRPDLLECPSSPPMLHPFLGHDVSHCMSIANAHSSSDHAVPIAAASATHHQGIQLHNGRDEKTPKKASMIGEEYEALLQSALEEQAQYYEGEITRLRAELMTKQVDTSQMSDVERREADELQRDICHLRLKIDAMSREVLSAQSQEAGHRAISQRLLHEQQVTHDLIAAAKEEMAREQEQGRWQIEELEQQIADLTADQRMRHQFSQHEELLHAQVFGTQTLDTRVDERQKKAGIKLRRTLRK